MTLFPPGTGAILRRELSFLSRRKTAYPLRILVLLGLLSVFLGLLVESSHVFSARGCMPGLLARFGQELLTFIFAALAAVLYVVMPAAVGGAIASEREAGRLELLRATPLHAVQIALEKLLARLVYALTWAVAVAPFFLVPLFFGGVSPRGIAFAVLGPVGAAVWVSSLALLLSSLRRRPIAAVLETYLLAGFFAASGAVFLVRERMLVDWPFHAFPVSGYLEIAGQQIAEARLEPLLWQMPLETLAFAGFCVLAAAARMRREAPGGGAEARGDAGPARRPVWDNAVAWKEAATGSGSALRRVMTAGLALYATGLLFANAVILRDLAARTERRGLAVSGSLWNAVDTAGVAALGIGLLGLVGAAVPRWRKALALLVGGIAIGAVAMVRLDPIVIGDYPLYLRRHEDLLLVATLVLGSLLAVAAALMSSQSVASERVRGTLEDLRLTPLAAESILDGKSLGCLWSLGPGLLLFALQLAALQVFHGLTLCGTLLALVTLTLTLATILQAGLWASSICRGPVRALLLVVVVAAATQAVTWALLALYPVVSMAGFYASPLFWLAVSIAWGDASYPAKLYELAPPFGLVLFWLAMVWTARALRRRAAQALEADR